MNLEVADGDLTHQPRNEGLTVKNLSRHNNTLADLLADFEGEKLSHSRCSSPKDGPRVTND
jgi:hypothetical protein